MNIQRITRLLKLAQLLQSGCGENISGLGKACSVSRRTAFRDIEALRRAGLPVTYDAAYDRYSISKSYYMPPINLTAEESLSLIALAAELGRNDRLPNYESARSGALKLESGLPQELREASREMRRAIRIQFAPTAFANSNKSVFQSLKNARQACQVLRIEYDTGVDQTPLVTKLRVYSLYFCRHSWYAIGRSSAHRGVKTFALGRIQSACSLNVSYTIPSDYCLETYLGNSWHVSPGNEFDCDVAIRFRASVADNIVQFQWHKTQVLEFEVGGSVIFRATVSGLNEIAWWIFGFADQAEVISPENLRRLVCQRARNIVAIYDREALSPPWASHSCNGRQRDSN